ncbi:MAG: ABC transporter ATP-binding protein [Bryobacteraceae bacterium]
MSALYQLRGVGMRYEGREVLRNISLEFGASQLVGIVGPNGAGKSTLLGIMANLRRRYLGECRLQGVELRSWQRKGFARMVSFVPQSLRVDFPFTVEEVVLMGRTPYGNGMFESAEDWKAVERAMELTGVTAFRHRDVRTLSGGERQSVVLASALAQTPHVLLLDEPATFLDLNHQVSLYRLLRKLCDEGLLVITVSHDMNLTAAFCHRVIMLRAGEMVADAPPAEALCAERIAAVFGVPAEVHRTRAGRHWIVYG